MQIDLPELPDDALRQYIVSRSKFHALQETVSHARQYRGSMFWRRQNGRDYLIRTNTAGAQKSLGPRSPETEAMFGKFTDTKKAIEERHAKLKEEVLKAERLNRALFVGRVDDKIIDILHGFSQLGLEDNFIVIGTNALYAYEAAAGVRIEERHLATNDLDLLWDNRRKLSLAVRRQLSDRGLLGLLQRIDKSFRLKRDQLYTAVNDDGYELDILRPQARAGRHEPDRFSDHEEDFWAVQARNASWLLGAPKFREVVVSTRGKMAEMITVDPRAFVLFKLWMMEQKDRDPLKRSRDGNQAKAVLEIIDTRLPQFSFADLPFPFEARKLLTSIK